MITLTDCCCGVLKSLTLTVPAGSCLSLMGSNGAGKSTLLKLCAGLIDVESGLVNVSGSLQYLMQEADYQILGSTVREDCLLGFPDPTTDTVRKAQELMRRYGLTQFDEPVSRLSYGQKRKLTLVAALMSDPAVILMDEPFAGLDADSVDCLLDDIRRLRESGKTLVIAHHEPARLKPVLLPTDPCVILKNGVSAYQGCVSDSWNYLRQNPDCGVRAEKEAI